MTFPHREADMPDDSAPIWARLDEHTTAISSMRERQAGTDAKLESLESRIDRQYHQMSDTLSRIEIKTEETGRYVEQSRGGLKIGAWIAGAVATIVSIAVAVYTAIRNGGGG